MTTPRCMPWTWYVDNDMVFFIFMPWLMMIYKKNRKIAYITYFLLILSNVIYLFTVTMVADLPGFVTIDSPRYNKYIYRKPWGRYAAYVAGIIIGCMYFEYRNHEKHERFRNSFGTKLFTFLERSRVFRIVFFFIGWAFINLAIFVHLPEQKGFTYSTWPTWANAIFNSVSRPTFIMGLFMVLAGCFVGGNRVISYFMNAPIFNSWAKVSFMTYLI